MRTRATLGALVATLLAMPAAASADGLLDSLTSIYQGSQRPVPDGRGKLNAWDAGAPCQNPLVDEQADYWGHSPLVGTWDQFGTPPTLMPPGTYWIKGDQEGFVPTDPAAAQPIPPTVTSVPADARRLTTTRWTVVPASGRLVPYQPATSLVCSALYRMSYTGPYSPWGSKGAVATAVCADANSRTPFVQWVQNLGTDTPGMFNGISTSQALLEALRKAGLAGGSGAASTLIMNALKPLWGGSPGSVLVGAVGPALSAAVNGYLGSVAEQTTPISNAVWDYYADTGVSWMTWAPVRSEMAPGKLAINLVSANPATMRAAIAVACTSTPTLQGNVLDLRVQRDGGGVRLNQLGPSYYGTPLNGATPRAAQPEEDDARVADTVVGVDEDELDVDTGAGPDHVNGSPGDDVVRGGPGDDKIDGGEEGADRLRGGPGSDLLLDDSEDADAISGGAGIDRIDVRDRDGAVDRVRCGPGEDIVLADPRDRVAADCEHVFRNLDDAPRNLDDALGQARNWPPARGEGA